MAIMALTTLIVSGDKDFYQLIDERTWLFNPGRGGPAAVAGETVRLASDAYFFEEGQWKTFESARYGELRVDDDGNAVLTGLRDENFQPLGPAT